MKVRIMLSLVLGFLSVMAGAEAVQAGSTGNPIELKVSSFVPESHHLNITARKVFGEIEKNTGGKVRFVYYDAGTLANAKQQLQATIDGVTDISTIIVPAYTPGRFPLTSLLDLAPNIPYASDASVAAWEFYNKRLKDEWKHLKVLAVYMQVPQHIHTAKVPIRTFSDLTGKQIRSYGCGLKMVQAWGGTPVFIPISDTYLALEKGVCSGIMASFTEMKPLKLQDVTKCHTIIGCLASPFIVGMNLAKYNALPQDVKTAFDNIAVSASKEWGEGWDRLEVESVKALKEEGGHEFILLPPKELAKWRTKASSINDAWIADLEKQGVPAGEAFKERERIWKKYVDKEKPWAEWIKQ